MKLSFLPSVILEAIKKVAFIDVYEVRLRLNKPILVNLLGEYYYVQNESLTKTAKNPQITSAQMLEGILFKVTDGSIYAYSEQMKQGFLTIAGGIRIGITGEVVSERGDIIQIKNVSSLNIRIPHEVLGCCNAIFNHLINQNTLHNTLIISPPAAGKTTILRDIARQISTKFPQFNVLILDERYEISASVNGVPELDVGQADVMLGCNKQLGFECGIRSMSPHIILTDEIAKKEDIDSILYANGCGVNVIATVHAFSHKDLENKSYFNEILQKKVFTRFVVLSNRLGVGTIEGVYDEHFKNLLEEKNICNLSLV